MWTSLGAIIQQPTLMFDVFGWEAWKWVAHLLISVWEVGF